MRVVAGLFTGLFLLAAGVQWNDPDPFIWIAGYLLAVFLAAAAAAGKSWPRANAGAAVLFGIWFSTLAPSLLGAEPAAFGQFEMADERHEEPREAVGLGLCAGWCAAMAWRQSKALPDRASPSTNR